MGVRRGARRLALGRNPLRRRVDRLRVWGTVAAVLLFVVGAPLAARPAMGAVRAAAVRTAQAQEQQRHPVSAILPRGARPSVSVEGIMPDRVAARWPGPDGRWHRGVVRMEVRVRPGGLARIWVDDRGTPVARPLTASQIDGRTALGGVAAGVGVALVLGPALLVLRWRLDRRAYAEWELEWAEMEPRWTRRKYG